MSNPLKKIDSPFCVHETTALVFKPETSFDEWQKQGDHLGTVIKLYTNHIRWWLGDWLIFGEDKFTDRYSQALDASMYSIGTLRNCVWVCRHVPPENRFASLSFDHHYEVAKLNSDQQTFWLQEAANNKWTVRELRRAVSGDKNPVKKCLPDKLVWSGESDSTVKVMRSFEDFWVEHNHELVNMDLADAIKFTWEEARK